MKRRYLSLKRGCVAFAAAGRQGEGDEHDANAARKAMAAVHWTSSALFVIAYVVHLVMRPVVADGRSAAEAGAANVPSPT